MITVPAPLLDILGTGLWSFALLFVRVSAVVSLLPAFGERVVSVRVKLGLALVLSITVAPLAPAPALDPLAGLADLAEVILAETLVGLALGLGVRLFILALQTAGSMAAQATSLSQLLGAAGIDPSPALGHVLVVSGLALAVTLGLHVRTAEMLVLSFDLFPQGEWLDASDLADWGVAQTSRAFGLAFTLAAPFVIASVLYNLALGVINRAMPQLMVAFVGAPAITMGGLFLLFAAAPLMLAVWVKALNAFLASPLSQIP